jgi:hypothetical protein
MIYRVEILRSVFRWGLYLQTKNRIDKITLLQMIQQKKHPVDPGFIKVLQEWAGNFSVDPQLGLEYESFRIDDNTSLRFQALNILC